jgi:hypothetical protein
MEALYRLPVPVVPRGDHKPWRLDFKIPLFILRDSNRTTNKYEVPIIT